MSTYLDFDIVFSKQWRPRLIAPVYSYWTHDEFYFIQTYEMHIVSHPVNVKRR